MKKNAIFAVIFLVTVSACSFKTLYNNLDYFIVDYVEGMVELDDVLYKKLDRKTDVFLLWHRRTQLPEYADWLLEVKRDVRYDIKPEEILKHVFMVEKFWKTLSLKFSYEMIDVFVYLEKTKIDELFEGMSEKNKDFKEKRVQISSEERAELYSERLLDLAELWLGDISESQELMIKKSAANIKSVAHLRLIRHTRWRKGLKEILENEATHKKKSNELKLYFSTFSKNKSSEIERLKKYNREVLTELALEFVKTLSKKQLEYMQNELDSYIRLFTELSTEKDVS